MMANGSSVEVRATAEPFGLACTQLEWLVTHR